MGHGVSSAWAQMGPAAGPAAGGRPTDLLFLMAGVFGIFYFLVIRPEQKRKKDHDALVAGLKRNDRVMLSSGIHGRVMGMNDKTIAVEIAPKVTVEVERSHIQQVETDSSPATKS